MRFVAVGFTLWAAVVGWSANRIIAQIDAIHAEAVHSQEKLAEFILVSEKRLTALEDYNKVQDVKRDRIEYDLQKHLLDIDRENDILRRSHR
jgi:hypothetical protein